MKRIYTREFFFSNFSITYKFFKYQVINDCVSLWEKGGFENINWTISTWQKDNKWKKTFCTLSKQENTDLKIFLKQFLSNSRMYGRKLMTMDTPPLTGSMNPISPLSVSLSLSLSLSFTLTNGLRKIVHLYFTHSKSQFYR